jgi:hypothetical protein
VTSNLPEWGFEADHAGARRCRYLVALRLSHPSTDPHQWSSALGMQPKVIDTAGEPRIRGSRTLSAAKCSFWTHQFRSPSTAKPFEDFLDELADRLRPYQDVFVDLAASGGDAEFFIGYMLESPNYGFALSAKLQRKLSDLGIALSFDVYDWLKEGDEAEATTAQST